MSDELDATVRRQLVAGAGAIGALKALLTTGALGHVSHATRQTVSNLIGEWHGAPYPQHCRHPEQCAGKGSCPRDPTCVD